MRNTFANMLLSFIFVLVSNLAHSQSDQFVVDGDVWAPSERQEVASSAIWVIDEGKIAVVGYTQASESNRDGFLMLYDPVKRTVERATPFSRTLSDEYKCVARADNSTLYVAGSTLNERGEKKSLMLRYNIAKWPNHEDPYIFGEVGSAIEKMVWLHDDRGLLAGVMQRYNTGSIWLSTVTPQGVPTSQRQTIGGGNIQNLKGMLSDRERQCVWLFGNTMKLAAKRSAPWVAKLNSQLQQDIWEPLENLTPHGKVTAGTLSEGGVPLMVGYSKETNNGSEQGWFYEMVDGRSPILFGMNQPDTATAICEISSESPMIAFCTLPVGGVGNPKSRQSVWYREWGNEQIDLFARARRFEVVAMFPMGENDVVLVANSDGLEQSDRQGVRFLHLRRVQGAPRSRGDRTNPIGPSMEIKETRIKTEKNGCAAPDEIFTLYCTLKNTGDAPFQGGRLSIASPDGGQGKTLTLPIVAPGKEAQVSTGLVMPSGRMRCTWAIALQDAQERPLDKRSVSVDTCSRDSEIVKKRPQLFAKNDPVSPVSRGEAVVNFTLRTQDPVLKGEVKVVVKGKKQSKDGRSNTIAVKDSRRQPDAQFDTEVNCTIPLDTGYNDIQIMLGDYILPNIFTVEYKPGIPDLHVFAIGPTYPEPFNLQFVQNDVQEFVQKMAEQTGRGLFDTVFVKTLAHPNVANKRNIQIFLDSLPSYRTIKENDYVVMYIAGHGSRWRTRSGVTTEDFCFWPSDYIQGNDEIYGFNYNSWVKEVLNPIKCKKLIFIDACHSGAGRGGENARDINDALQRANEILDGVVSFYSSTAEQRSQEHESWQHGAFTKALLEALTGRPVKLSNGNTIDPDGGYPSTEVGDKLTGVKDRLMTIYELNAFLNQRVPDLIRSVYGNTIRQTPSFRIKPDLTEDTLIFMLPKR